MKVVRNTPQHLVLQSVPWLFAVLFSCCLLGAIWFGLDALFSGDMQGTFWGLVVIVPFLTFFLVIFVRRDEVILDRTADLLELRHSTFRGRTTVQHKLNHLTRAKLQSSRTSKGAVTYRIALVLDGGMDAGIHPVTPIYVSGNGAKHGVEAINTWLSETN